MLITKIENVFCNKITPPEFTAEQIARCNGINEQKKRCRHISDKGFCSHFGIRVKEGGKIIQPSRKTLILPNEKREGCCGAILEFLQRGSEIAEGYLNLELGKKLEFTDRNMQTCLTCEFGTWLTIKEYIGWLKENGITLLIYFRNLTLLPPLPKKEKIEGYGQQLYCMLCKCYLKAKTRTKSPCPMGKFKMP